MELSQDHERGRSGEEEQASIQTMRRTTRLTAGQHSNRFHLPRAAVRNGDGGEEVTTHPTVNSLHVVFRPWC